MYVDGTPIFDDPEARKSEDEVAAILSERWNCNFVRYGILCQVDWYVVQFGRVIGFAELKTRYHAVNTYSTVFLAVRKWIALKFAAMTGVPSIFVVRFKTNTSDEIRWESVNAVDPSKMILSGHANPRVPADEEPLIEVPVPPMKTIEESPLANN